MDDNENYLILKAQKGDIEAFEKLIVGYEKKVFNIALKVTENKDKASELAQAIFIGAYRSIKSFSNVEEFSNWLMKIALNLCISELNKKRFKNDRKVRFGMLEKVSNLTI